MRLFYLVKQHHGVGSAAHLFGELSRLVKAHISRRRADELETVWRSIYSDISTLISGSVASNSVSPSTFTSSVLPTPVGPTKMNDAGRLLFAS